jgi:hypothetical protein
MRVHFDVLGWLYVLVGVMGVVTGLSLGILAIGTLTLGSDSASGTLGRATVLLFAGGALLLLVAGGAMMAIGRSLGARRPGGRLAALMAAAVNLAILPFGTALGIYTVWALINDEARVAFGRRARAPDIQSE